MNRSHKFSRDHICRTENNTPHRRVDSCLEKRVEADVKFKVSFGRPFKQVTKKDDVSRTVLYRTYIFQIGKLLDFGHRKKSCRRCVVDHDLELNGRVNLLVEMEPLAPVNWLTERGGHHHTHGANLFGVTTK